MRSPAFPLPWLAPGEPFPPPSRAWGEGDPAPGLLAAGGALDTETLRRAYSSGIFPWFSEGQPILWWSPDPRMVLDPAGFRLHRSLRKTIDRLRAEPRFEIRIDTAFSDVIRACAQSPRDGQAGTWIVPEMIRAYEGLHADGFAHSVETWLGGELLGGLYCVGLGKAVFGESMFSRATDASKVALAALVAFCRHHGIGQIDCQQNTRHLASLGAREVQRDKFLVRVAQHLHLPAPEWRFEPVYWNELKSPASP